MSDIIMIKKYSKGPREVMMVSLLDTSSLYYRVFLIDWKQHPEYDLKSFVKDFYNNPVSLQDYSWSYLDGRDLFPACPFYWTLYENVLNARGMRHIDVIDLSNIFIHEDGWQKIEFRSFDSLVSYLEDKGQISEPVKVIAQGCACRACKEYNPYAEIDNVVNDGMHTCWGCADSSNKIGIGLSDDYHTFVNQKIMIQTINKIRN